MIDIEKNLKDPGTRINVKVCSVTRGDFEFTVSPEDGKAFQRFRILPPRDFTMKARDDGGVDVIMYCSTVKTMP